MNKKGLTVVELIVSFTLTMTIVVFLIQIVISLTRIYSNNSMKTELLNAQAIISDNINTAFMEKQLIDIEDCGENCYKFYYQTGDTDTLKLNKGILKFEKVAMDLKDASFGDFSLDVIYTPTIQEGVNNAILTLNIPIKSNLDYNFDIKVIYQFNTSISDLDEYFSS